MKSYAELRQHPAVKSAVPFGAGIVVVTLNSGYGNPNFGNYHSANQELTAPFLRTAVEFVEGAEASTYADSPGGNPCRVKEGTPRSCNPHSELYWSM